MYIHQDRYAPNEGRINGRNVVKITTEMRGIDRMQIMILLHARNSDRNYLKGNGNTNHFIIRIISAFIDRAARATCDFSL